MRMQRWFVFALLVPGYTVMLLILGSLLLGLIATEWFEDSSKPFFSIITDMLGDPEWWIYGGGIASISVALQAVFLIPLFDRRPPRGERPRALMLSFIIGSFVAALLMVGMALSLVELFGLLYEERYALDQTEDVLGILIGTLFFGGWGFWTLCLIVFVRDIWSDRVLGRMVGILIAGTVLEFIVVLPIDIMVRRKTNCYCYTGTFFTLCIASATALWLTGPGIAIALLSKKHRMWRRDHCLRCGYSRGPSPGDVCPECGYKWKEGPEVKKKGDGRDLNPRLPGPQPGALPTELPSPSGQSDPGGPYPGAVSGGPCPGGRVASDEPVATV